jgi:NAD(P)-dependent dehydrogenase (short-subunit alcohol dehydrogenase family)
MAASTTFEGKVALVTGGASGIGRATVRTLAAEGATVAVVDRDEAGATAVAAGVAAAGGRATAYVIDLADPSAIAPLVARVLADHGRIDVLVNSAGMSGAPHSAVEFRDEIMELVLSVNLRAPMLLVREVGRHMVERGGGGRIVSLSSSAAFRSTSSPVVYAATKAGINGMTRAAAADLGPHDINVNAVAPGLTKTPMTASMGDDEGYRKAATSGPLANLLHRASEAEDVANVIVFLCRPESRQITGQVVNTSAGLVV